MIDNNFICKQCKVNYALKHDENILCVEKTSLQGNNNYYTNDTGINYYSCSLYNNALNCD